MRAEQKRRGFEGAYKSGGFGWSVMHDVEIRAVSRIGIVKVTA
jgi:hypothetical protein